MCFKWQFIGSIILIFDKMKELIDTFHIDWRLIIAQAVNFGLVVFVLFRFAYKPLLKLMNERSREIEKGLKDAKEAKEALANANEAGREEIIKAKKEAKQIIEKANQQSKENIANSVEQAQAEAERVLAQAKEEIASEKKRALAEIKQEVGELVYLTTEKVVDKRLSQKEKDEITELAK